MGRRGADVGGARAAGHAAACSAASWRWACRRASSCRTSCSSIASTRRVAGAVRGVGVAHAVPRQRRCWWPWASGCAWASPRARSSPASLRAQAARRMPIVDVLSATGATVLARGRQLHRHQRPGLHRAGVFRDLRHARSSKLPLPTTLALLMASAVVFAGSIVVFANWSDRFGRRRDHAVGPGRAGALVAGVLPAGRHRSVGSADRAVAVRDAVPAGRVHRAAAGGVLGALSDRGALQRRVAEPDAGDDARRRHRAHRRHGALRDDGDVALHHLLHHGDVADLVAVLVRPSRDVSRKN